MNCEEEISSLWIYDFVERVSQNDLLNLSAKQQSVALLNTQNQPVLINDGEDRAGGYATLIPEHSVTVSSSSPHSQCIQLARLPPEDVNPKKKAHRTDMQRFKTVEAYFCDSNGTEYCH